MKHSVISSSIRILRKRAGYTQEEVSNKLSIQRQTYCNYENATRTPPLDIIVALADLYQVSVDYLVRDEKSLESISAHELLKKALLDEFFSLPKAIQNEVLDFIRFKKTTLSRE